MNYGDQGGCYPSRPQAQAGITLRDLHNCSFDAKPNSIIVLLFIQNNPQFKNKAKTCLPLSMLSSPSIVHVQGCSAPQIFSKQQMSPFELCCFCSGHVFSYNFAYFLLLKRVKCPPFFVFTRKTTQPRPQGFSVNGALTSKNAAFLTSFPR